MECNEFLSNPVIYKVVGIYVKIHRFIHVIHVCTLLMTLFSVKACAVWLIHYLNSLLPLKERFKNYKPHGFDEFYYGKEVIALFSRQHKKVRALTFSHWKKIFSLHSRG